MLISRSHRGSLDEGDQVTIYYPDRDREVDFITRLALCMGRRVSSMFATFHISIFTKNGCNNRMYWFGDECLNRS